MSQKWLRFDLDGQLVWAGFTSKPRAAVCSLSPPTSLAADTLHKSSAHKRASFLTWLCCCCWSLSWRIAWASPPVALPVPAGGLSVESVRTMSTTAGEEAPTAPLLSRSRPRLARTHMGNTDVADMLDSSSSCRRTYVKRTKAADWLRPVWVAGRRTAESSERPHGEGGGRGVERLVQSDARVSLTFGCDRKLPWWLMAKCPKSAQLYHLYEQTCQKILLKLL